MKKNKKIILAIISGIGFLVILLSILFGRSLFIDNLVYPANLRSDLLTKVCKVVTILGDKYFIAALVVLIAGILFLKKKRKTSILLCFNLFNIVVLNKVIKYLVARPRPANMLIEKDGYSFPSGHSMLSIGVYGFLIYLICKSNLSKSLKRCLTIVLSLIIFIVGITRLYLGVHYPSDVLGGYLLSFAYLLVFITIVYDKKKDLKK